MSYVTYVFRTVFGYAKPKAEKLMLDVHHKGRAVVSSGGREAMERDARDAARLRPVGNGQPRLVTGTGGEPWPEADLENDLAGFRASAGGATARFAAAQAAIIRSLVGQVAELVGGDEMPVAAAMPWRPSAAGLAAQLGLAESADPAR